MEKWADVGRLKQRWAGMGTLGRDEVGRDGHGQGVDRGGQGWSEVGRSGQRRSEVVGLSRVGGREEVGRNVLK